MRMKFLILVSIYLIVLISVQVGYAFESSGRTTISPNIDLKSRNIALFPELKYANASEAWFQQFLTSAFTSNGFSVIERGNFDKIIRELGLDQTGAVKGKSKDASSSDESKKDTTQKTRGDDESKADMVVSRFELKKIGELLGVRYIGFFTLDYARENAYLRIVDCQTAEVVATSIFENTKLDDLTDTASMLMVMSIRLAAQEAQTIKKPVVARIEVGGNRKKSGERGIKKVLFEQERYDSKLCAIFISDDWL